MIDLTIKALPDTVMVDGKAFLINTDFRVWLRFERDLKKHNKDKQPFDVSYLFPEDMPAKIDINKLIEFERPPKELPRPIGQDDGRIIVDFDIDSDLIYAAFWQTYGIDLLTADLHWYQFTALFSSISEETMMAKVMGYRSYKKTDRKRDIRDELRRSWEILPELTDEERKEIEEFESLFA